MEEDKIKNYIRSELKKAKIILAVLSISAIVSTVANMISIYNYNQALNKEKLASEHTENVLHKIEVHYHLEE